MRVVCGIRLAFQAERCRFEPCSPLITKVNMFNFFKKEKWALVKSFKEIFYSKNYHIHLFESETGNRKAEYFIEGEKYPISALRTLESSDLYQLKIYRWLQGRRDPDIPMYCQIGEDDTANFLKGSV